MEWKTVGLVGLNNSSHQIGQIINIGTGIEISIQQLGEKIGGIMSCPIELVQEMIRIRPPASEVDRLCCNPEKLKKITSFHPQISLEEGLAKTIEWFLAHQSEHKVGLYHV